MDSDIKGYLLENYLDITYKNLIYFPKVLISELKAFPTSDLLKITFDKSNGIDLNTLNNLILLKNLGIAFLELKKETLYVGIPLIKEIKGFLKDKNLINENNKVCEIVDIITGMCEVYGAIKLKQAQKILKTFYPNMNDEQFFSYILLCLSLVKISTDTNKVKNKLFDYIEHLAIDPKSTKEILKSKKDLKIYTKEEYLKFGDSDFLKNTKGYQMIMNQFKTINPDIIDIQEIFEEVIFNYSIDYRLNKPNSDKMLEALISNFEDNEFAEVFFDIDVKEIRKGIKLLQKELPKWN